MVGFLERYRGGEHEAVWAELLALGEQVRSEPLYSEARAVAGETMTRGRRNLELLGQAQGMIQALLGGVRAIPDEMGRMAGEGAPSERFQQLHGLAEELRGGLLRQGPAPAGTRAPASDPLVVWPPHDDDPDAY